jgi:hypothetical protein
MQLSDSAKLIYPALASLSDASIKAFTTSAVEWIQQTYGRNIQGGQRCHTFSSMGEQVLFLPDTPVCGVQSIKINGQEWIDFDHCVNVGRNGRMTLGGARLGIKWNQLHGWSPGINNIKVVYTSEGLTQSMFDLYVGEVINWWVDSNSRSVMVTSESIGDYSYVLNTAAAKGIPVRVSTILSSLVPCRAY